MNETLRHALHTLEKQLLDPAIRAQRNAVAVMLAADFREFGKSGRVYDRAAMLTLLETEAPHAVAIEEFDATLLGPEAALVTYLSRHTDGQSASRCSVWVYREGRWQLLFHQGTAT